MDVKNNPAGRLYDLLSAARNQSGDAPAKKAWATVFGVAETDIGVLLKMLADLIDLMHEAKAAIGKLKDVEHRLYLHPFSNLERMMSQINLEARWQESRNRLDDATNTGARNGCENREPSPQTRSSRFPYNYMPDLARIVRAS